MIVTRRYFFRGPWPLDLKLKLDPGLVLPVPGFVIAYDLTYDDAVVDLSSVDESMRQYGCFPDLDNTIALSPSPFVGIVSPDGSIWKLIVNNLGVLAVIKVDL